MKQKILYGTIFTIIIILLVPSIPAIEYNSSIRTIDSDNITKIKNRDLKELLTTIKKNEIYKFREGIKNIDFRSTVEKLKDHSAQPQCIIILMTIKILVKVFGSIMGVIINGISSIIDIIVLIISKIIEIAFAILKPIIKLTVLALIIYFIVIAIIDLSFLSFFIFLILLGRGS